MRLNSLIEKSPPGIAALISKSVMALKDLSIAIVLEKAKQQKNIAKTALKKDRKAIKSDR
jgi:hypothetical protein